MNADRKVTSGTSESLRNPDVALLKSLFSSPCPLREKSLALVNQAARTVSLFCSIFAGHNCMAASGHNVLICAMSRV